MTTRLLFVLSLFYTESVLADPYYVSPENGSFKERVSRCPADVRTSLEKLVQRTINLEVHKDSISIIRGGKETVADNQDHFNTWHMGTWNLFDGRKLCVILNEKPPDPEKCSPGYCTEWVTVNVLASLEGGRTCFEQWVGIPIRGAK